MEQRQFIELMESKGALGKEAVPMLEDFVSRFPYCQTGHLLFAKSLHDQHSIHFDQQLKTAAVYASDRKILYDLIHPPTEEFVEEETPVFKEEPVFPFVDSKEENPFVEVETGREEKQVEEEPSVFKEVHTSQNVFSEDYREAAETSAEETVEETAPVSESSFTREKPSQEWYSEADLIAEISDERPPVHAIVDPHEVIRRRLSEILGKDTSEKKEEVDTKPEPTAFKKEQVEETPSDVVEEKSTETFAEVNIAEETVTPPAVPDEKQSDEEIIQQQAKKAHDVIDRIGLEHAMEENILHSLEKLPVIKPAVREIKEEIFQKEIPKREADVTEARSFLDWLKVKSAPTFGKVEEVHADDPLPVETEEASETPGEHLPHVSKTELIDQFIATEPRIVPSKAEFYSPINQAKKSLAEHDDLVSETLARIYFDQGNLPKARSSYQKLILLHPEKSSYFAALIQEIDHLLNKQE